MYKRFKIDSDAYINSYNPYKNYGASKQLYVFKTKKDPSGQYTLETEQELRSVIYINHDEIIDALSANGKSIDDEDVSVELNLVISNWLVDSPDFSISCYPLLQPFYENYGHDLNSITDGVNWIDSDENTPWTDEGGYYDDLYDDITVELNDENMSMTINLKQFISDVNSEVINNYGFILIPNKTARNFALYSSQSNYALPYVNVFYDNYSIEQSDRIVAFDTNTIPHFKTRLSKSRYKKSESLELKLLIMEKYATASYEYDNRISYLPNVKYRLVDKTRNRLLVDYRDETRVPVTEDGNSLSLSLNDLKIGFYELELMYENQVSGRKFFDRVEFRIE